MRFPPLHSGFWIPPFVPTPDPWILDSAFRYPFAVNSIVNFAPRGWFAATRMRPR
jgi:hypothetical protein